MQTTDQRLGMDPDRLAFIERLEQQGSWRLTEEINSLYDILEECVAEIRRLKKEPRPAIVCLCGSTRFMDAFHQANRQLSLNGMIVLTVEIATYDGATDPQGTDPDTKAKLDALHLRKIDLADAVLILNVDDTLGNRHGPSSNTPERTTRLFVG